MAGEFTGTPSVACGQPGTSVPSAFSARTRPSAAPTTISRVESPSSSPMAG